MPLTRLRNVLRRFGIAIAFALLLVVLSVLSGSFLTISNLLNIARQVSINAVIAAGMTFVILAGGIDLSVGSVLAFSGAVIAGLLAAGRPVPVGIGGGLAVGALLGLVNGLVITRGRVQPFIATLGMLTIGRGLTLVYTDGRPITGLPDAFVWLGAGEVFRIPVPVLIMMLVFLASYVILTQTVVGRYVYAIGGNEEAARLSGVNVAAYKTLVYVISGVVSAASAVILTGRLNSAQPTAGVGFELDAIAAVVLGGTTLAGGEGSIGGTILGAFIIGVINNGLNLLNVNPFYQQVVKGAVILLAVLLDRRLR
ncbi:MAG: ribose ABC transporter permease [Bacillati bacterium ANGP1]|uniref:Ribose ABC transporter permease n=1 Tax=Candidatus Segetimicrobium genomatis TaxID=2569760 RepID=A0A537IXF5_9BACT|nr:MAG: ribose ABC transporter permease [Terrabacteria group bacterium ANGP1]